MCPPLGSTEGADSGVAAEAPTMKTKDLFDTHAWNGAERMVFWSGGHDSTVSLHLALEHWRDWNPHVVFVDICSPFFTNNIDTTTRNAV